MTNCSVKGCSKDAIAQLLDVRQFDAGYRCTDCLEHDLEL